MVLSSSGLGEGGARISPHCGLQVNAGAEVTVNPMRVLPEAIPATAGAPPKRPGRVCYPTTRAYEDSGQVAHTDFPQVSARLSLLGF